MSALKNLMVSDFLLTEKKELARIEEEIRTVPMSYGQKIEILENLLKKGIKFGIQKGSFLEEERLKRIRKAKERALERHVDELMFEINRKIAEYKDQPRIKYSKRKYRMRKRHGGTQLTISFIY